MTSSPPAAAAATSTSMSSLVRLAALRLSEVPGHPDLPVKVEKKSAGETVEGEEDEEQPELLRFVAAVLGDGLSFLGKSEFGDRFKKHSVKKAGGSKAEVEVLTWSVGAGVLGKDVRWKGKEKKEKDVDGEAGRRKPSVGEKGVGRAEPANLPGEHWFARRSVHENVSSKVGDGGSASWEEFVFGLRDDHSKHEEDFTPTLFDARKVVDWSGQLRKLEEEGNLVREGFKDVSMGVFEMCHDVPSPLKPRCFGVLVVTGNVLKRRQGDTAGSSKADAADAWWSEGEKEKFVAVTIPVQLGIGVKKTFYANYRNLKEGEDEKRKREVVQGLYVAVETCTLKKKGEGEGEGDEVEWMMATASDAKGILPMWCQKLALPGAVAKDVSYFMKWIRTVDEAVVDGSKT